MAFLRTSPCAFSNGFLADRSNDSRRAARNQFTVLSADWASVDYIIMMSHDYSKERQPGLYFRTSSSRWLFYLVVPPRLKINYISPLLIRVWAGLRPSPTLSFPLGLSLPCPPPLPCRRPINHPLPCPPLHLVSSNLLSQVTPLPPWSSLRIPLQW
jgi:hypothetical protein